MIAALVADYADWGIDESVNLWLATKIVSGDPEPLGLISSVGIPNLAGAPLMTVPLTWMPDLVWVSRGLSLFSLVGLSLLAGSLRKKGTIPLCSFAVLLCFPSLLLASGNLWNLWNQFLLLPLSALSVALLLALLRRSDEGMSYGHTCVVFLFLAFLKPAVHLIGCVDWFADLLLLSMVFVLRGPPRPHRSTFLSLLILFIPLGLLYVPWSIEFLRWTDVRWGRGAVLLSGLGIVSVLGTGGLLIRRFGLRNLLTEAEKIFGESRGVGWALLFFLLLILTAAGTVSFLGVQSGNRLLRSGASAGVAVFLCQCLLILPLGCMVFRGFPVCLRGKAARDLIHRLFPLQPREGVFLLVYAVLLLFSRQLLVPRLLWVVGRADLFVSLVPAMLAPACLMLEVGEFPMVRRVVVFTAFMSILSMGWLGVMGPTRVLAGQHRKQGGEGEIDLGYDLIGDRFWIPDITAQGTHERWYSIGRPYDWLLLRRHGIRNAHEGRPDRTTVGRLQLGYVYEGPAPEGMRLVYELPHLHVRVRETP